MKADLQFGVEPVEIDGVTVALDIGMLADEMYESLLRLPDDTNHLKEFAAAAPLINEVLTRNRLPAIASPVAAYKFAQDVIGRALVLKKLAREAWASADAPESADSFPE